MLVLQGFTVLNGRMVLNGTYHQSSFATTRKPTFLLVIPETSLSLFTERFPVCQCCAMSSASQITDLRSRFPSGCRCACHPFHSKRDIPSVSQACCGTRSFRKHLLPSFGKTIQSRTNFLVDLAKAPTEKKPASNTYLQHSPDPPPLSKGAGRCAVSAAAA